MNKSKAIYIIQIFFLFNCALFAQSKTNLELVDSLILISTSEISEKISDENYGKIYLDFIASEDYQIMKSSVIGGLLKNKISVVEEKSESDVTVSYNLMEIKTGYQDMFRDGWFGAYLVKRKISVDGSYLLSDGKRFSEANSFYHSIEDTVGYEGINNLENIAYSFASGDLPEEPLLSSTLEPVIAIGTAAVAVYLFFNVRSK